MFSKWQPIIILFSPHSVVDYELTGLSALNSILFVIYGTLKIAAGDKAPE